MRRTGIERVFTNPCCRSFLSVIADCDKLASSYLKPSIGQMVRSVGRGGNEMGFTTELILGAAILTTTPLSHYYYQFHCSFSLRYTSFITLTLWTPS